MAGHCKRLVVPRTHGSAETTSLLFSWSGAQAGAQVDRVEVGTEWILLEMETEEDLSLECCRHGEGVVLAGRNGG